MKKMMSLLVVGLFATLVHGQTSEPITLQYCYDQIETGYPSAQKIMIQKQIEELNLKLRQTGLYPEFTVSGSASYQSDVTEVAFAGPAAPEFSKDHYSIALDINQPLFDAGRTKNLKALEQVSSKTANAGTEVELWNIRSQIDQVYFSILLLKKQKENIALLLKDLNEQLDLVKSRVENGVLLRSNELVLKAEILKVNQQEEETASNIKAGFKVLSTLIGEDIDEDAELELPEYQESKSQDQEARPEFELFKSKEEVLDAQIGLLGSDKLPVISAFAKTSYGRPGFNAFDDDLQFNWIVGLKAQWSFRNWRNSSTKEEVIRLQKQQNAADKDAFTRQLEANLSRSEEQMSLLQKQIKLDEQLLELREEVVSEKQSQLDQGVITSTEYITELNAENRARLNLEIHKVQLIQANYDYLTKRGISWK